MSGQKKMRLWEQMETVFVDDGKAYDMEISDEAWNAIADAYEKNKRFYRETCNDFKNNPLTVIGK